MNSLEQRFDAANTFLRGRVNVLNNLSSRELSEQLLPQIRAMSFFSARVAEARVLEKLRDVSDRYSSGKMDAATARLEIKSWLKSDKTDQSDLTDPSDVRSALMRTSRLNLILEQNAKTAAAVGAREVALDPEIYEAFPYYEYMPSTSINKNPEHVQFYNIVLDKKDPFWNTHTPPLEFGCKCYLRELTAEEAEGRVGHAKKSDSSDKSDLSDKWAVQTPDGRTINVPPSESGFVFDVAAPFDTHDLGRLNEPFREKVVGMMMGLAAKGDLGRLSFIGAAPGEASIVAPDLDDAGKALEKLAATAVKAEGETPSPMPEALKNAFPATLSLGELPPGHAAALGVKRVSLSLSAGGKSHGVAHNWIHHKKVFANPGESPAIWKESLFNEGARTAMTVIPKKNTAPRQVLAFHNPETKAFTAVEIKNGKGELLSWHRTDEGYTNYEWLLENKKGETE